MKIKSGLLTSAIVLGMVAPLALPVVANAADTTPAATADKSASVDVSAGALAITKDDSGNLEAPSFQFTGAKASTAAQNGLKAATFANEKGTTDKYAGSELAVDDNTGSGAGWHVTAKLGSFSDTASHSLSGATLHMNPASTASDDTDAAATASTTDLTAGASAASVVFSAAAGKGLGHSSTDFAGATLDLPSAEYAGHYVADLTYTLTSGPSDNPTA